MATARILNPKATRSGETAFIVEVSRLGEPFSAEGNRAWRNFTFIREDAAQFEFRYTGRAVDDEDDHAVEKAARKAIAALKLPRWARMTTKVEGGPGAAFDAVFLVLASGKCLSDVASHLAEASKP